MIYLKYLSDPSDLDHDLSDLCVRYIWSRSWSILSICPIYLIDQYLSDLDNELSVRYNLFRSWSIRAICSRNLINILIYLSDLSDLDHGLSGLSVRTIGQIINLSDLSVRSIWSRSWSILSICPIYFIYIMIYPADICDLNHHLSDLSVRSIWSRWWSIWSICPIYPI